VKVYERKDKEEEKRGRRESRTLAREQLYTPTRQQDQREGDQLWQYPPYNGF